MRSLLKQIADLSRHAQTRHLVAIAGAPGSGKSTLADQLADALRAAGQSVSVVPMDGFHLDNAILQARGMLHRKGAPETFDAAGFARMIDALTQRQDVVIPTFDRARDIAIAGARIVPADADVIVVEGNYLLFDDPAWSPLADLWSLSVRLDVPFDVLRARLVQRWLDNGYDAEAAVQKAEGNDLANARRILDHALNADVVLTSEDIAARP
ncbi:MAG: nucleoside triphosphate hydrolase [Pacificibacter sp.]|uniref:nucleoside triphosphate hydrolase n=1 Tax=Pacificibacter sp. TaxID=1917866 RepID=UPI00321C051A